MLRIWLFICLGLLASPAFQGHDTERELNNLVALEVQRLTSADPWVRTDAKRNLVAVAKNTPAGYELVVRNVLSLLKSREAHHPERVPIWQAGAAILGELRAEAAIPFLVSRLGINDGTAGMSLAHWPAARALVEIGPAAVPALAKHLSHLDIHRRRLAIIALASIGTSEALRELEIAGKSETSMELLEMIRSALEGSER